MTDPFLQADPYEDLSAVGITPASNMKQVLDAAGDLIEQGLWTAEKRAAWDALRTVERRLWVDLLRYPATTDEMIRSLEDLCGDEEPALPLPDVARLIRLDLAEFQSEWGADFDEPPEVILSRIEFDA